jgi:AraC-like DNA-binding protein
VLPDACIDIVWIGDNVPIVVGPATSSVIVPLAPRTWVLGARLKPGHAPAVLGFPAHEALNREVRLADVWGRDAAELSQRMHAQPSLTAKRALLEAALAKRTRPMATEDGDVGAAIAWLAAHPAGRVRELSCQLGISSRQLQRRFVSAVGYGPKTFQRIARFQRALAMAGPVFAAGVNMAGLAQDAGYTDQAHMSREVRDLSGRPAASMLGCVGSTLEMSDLFNTRLDAASYP